MVKNILGKAASPNKQMEKKERKGHVWLSGRLYIDRRWNEGPRLQRKHKDENEAKQTKITPEKDVMTSENQTPGGYKFAPLMASQQERAI